MRHTNMQEHVQRFFNDYAEALSKGDIGKITTFYAPVFVIEKDNQEIVTSNNTMFKANLWLRDFLTKWNDEILMKPQDISIQSSNDDKLAVKVRWSIHNTEGKEQKQQDVAYTLSNDNGLHIISSSI